MAQTPAPTTRPPLLQAAGITLIVIGGIQAVFLLYALVAAGSIGFGGAALPYVILGLALAGFSIYAGLQILKLTDQGRIMGLIAAGIGALFTLISLLQGQILSIIFLAAYGFVIYALITGAASFRRA